MSALLDLAARVEASRWADHSTDADVAVAVRYFPSGVGFIWQADLKANSPEKGRVECCTKLGTGGPHYKAPAYTTSLDAAMTLIGDAFWRVGHDGDGPDPSLFKATVGITKEGECWITFRTATAATPALALTAAALRAKAGQP